MVWNANLLRTFLQTRLAVGTLVSPRGSIGQSSLQSIGKLLLTIHVFGRLLVGQVFRIGILFPATFVQRCMPPVEIVHLNLGEVPMVLFVVVEQPKRT